MPKKKQSGLNEKGGVTPQQCRCIARIDDTDPERLALWNRVFPPDGKVPIIGARAIDMSSLAGQVDSYYMVDFDRVSSEQKGRFIQEMALKFHMFKEDIAADLTANGAPIMATGIVVDWCPMHDPKKETSGASTPEEQKGGLTMPKKKQEKLVSAAIQETGSNFPPPPASSDQTPDSPPVDPSLPPRVLRTEKRRLPHKLTDAEFRSRSMDLSLTFNETIQEEAHQKQIKEELKAVISALASKQAALARAIQTGEELVPVDVDITIAGDNAVVQEIRKDTGETINTRPATDFERQGAMFTGEDPFANEDKE